MALTVLTSIRIPLLAPLAIVAIKKSSTDFSPLVRKAAACAIGRIACSDASQIEYLVELLSASLKDTVPIVVGAAISTFNRICPEKHGMIHMHFRKICTTIHEMDECGQIETLKMMQRYALCNFQCPDSTSKLDIDLSMLWQCCKQLLSSQSSAVVIHTVLLYHYTEYNDLSLVAKPLLRLLCGDIQQQEIVLDIILALTRKSCIFANMYKHFVILDGDSGSIQSLKLKILDSIAAANNIVWIIAELKVI